MKLYTPLWSIGDPSEMLVALGQLEKSGVDYTLLTQKTIGIRPSDLFKIMKILKIEPEEVTDWGGYLRMENGKPVSGISMKSLDVLGDTYRAVFYVQGVGNITAATDNPELHDPELLILPYSGLYDAKKEEILNEYASFLGFKVS